MRQHRHSPTWYIAALARFHRPLQGLHKPPYAGGHQGISLHKLQVEKHKTNLRGEDKTYIKGRQGIEGNHRNKVFPSESLYKTLPEILQSEDILKLPGYKPKKSERHSSSDHDSDRHFLQLQGQVFCADRKLSPFVCVDRKLSPDGNEVEVAQIDDRNVDNNCMPDFKYESTGENTARLVYGDEQVIVEYEDEVWSVQDKENGEWVTEYI